MSEYFSNTTQGLNYQIYLPQGKYKALFNIVVEAKGTPEFEFERIIPRKGAEIIINLGDDMIGSFPNDKANIGLGEYTVKGNQIGIFDSYLKKDTHFIIIHFTPLGFRELITLPVFELNNSHIVNFGKDGLPELTQRMLGVNSFQERMNLLKNWAEKKVNNSHQDLLSTYIENRLSTHPLNSLRELEKLTGYTAKYLNRRFKKYTGYTLSNYKRLSRFHQVVDRLKKKEENDWADILYDYQYYDQSHFIKDFQTFTGLTPTELKYKLSLGHYNLTF